MMLTEKQRKILSSAQLQAHAPVSRIAEETGYREHTVRYCLEDLKAKGILDGFAFINPYPLGYTQYGIYFSRTSESKASRQKLLDALVDSSHTSWVAEFGGDFQYGVTVYAKRITDVDRFFSSLTERCGGRFFEKSFALPVSWTIFRSKYLSSHKSAVECLSGSGHTEEAKIDATDHRILKRISAPKCSSRTALARELGLPLTTLDYRIRRLEKMGVIVGYAYRVNPSVYGSQMFVLMIYAQNPSSELTDKLYRFSAAHPHVTSFTHCIGSWDYELRVEVKNSRSVAEITQEIHERFGQQIGNVKVLTFFESLKANTYPFQE
jgi:Lrp/AsnC family transcriptional regulator, leucine-responsive regulatory protein